MKLALKSLLPCLLLSTFCSAQTSAPAAPAEIKKDAKEEIDTTKLKHPLKPMLWKVEGKGLEKPSYLFGSIHLGDENIVKLHPSAEAAYQQSDTLATEVSMSLLNQLAAMQFINRKDKKTLEEALGEDLYKELEKEITAITPDFDVKEMKKFKTWGAVVTIGMLEKFGNHLMPLDYILWQRADTDDKGLWALETNKDQMGGFDKLTEKEQQILLKDTLTTLKVFREKGISALDIIRTPYLKGDGQGILNAIAEYEDIEGINKAVNEKFYQLLLIDRNVRMADKIVSKLTEQADKSHFMVAGTMHYLGDGSVVKLLQAKGYKVTLQQ